MTTPLPLPAITAIDGGLIAVQIDDLKHLGGHVALAGGRLACWAGRDAVRLIDPQVIASATLSPQTFVHLERSIFAATAHVAAAAAEWEALAAAVELVGQWCGGWDEEVRRTLDQALGHVLGTGLRLVVVAGGPEAAVLAAGGAAIGVAWWHVQSPAQHESEIAAVERFLTHHPGLVSDAATGLDAAVGGLLGVRLQQGAVMRNLTRLYLAEGQAEVAAIGLQPPGATRQPRSVADVVHCLREIASVDGPEGAGLIQVQTWTDPSGGRRHVVYLPGTDDPNPMSSDGDIRDVEEDLRVATGQPSAYADGVARAMRDAGIRPGDPVLLAGHSLGGMTAAKMLAEGSGFTITNVVTAGSPTAVERGFPAGSQVLSLQADGDLVPRVEGLPDAPRPEQTTVTFASGDDTILGNHDLGTYEAGAAAVDASHDPALQHAVEGLEPFFQPASGPVVSETFRITRAASQARS